jgi:O-antigen/teichoic acid export membrane protein
VDWEQAQANLRRTIGSALLAAGTGDAIVVVACHDEPDLDDLKGDDVHLLSVPFAEPTDVHEGGSDKSRKRRFAGAWLRQVLVDDEVYVMFLDADDLVRRDVLEHVLEHRHGSYVVDHGYLFDVASGLLWHRRRGFHRTCGSSFVCRFARNELPTSWEDTGSPFGQFGTSPEQRGHQEYDQVAAELGRPPARFPFPAVVYTVNHSESLRRAKSGDRGGSNSPRDFVWPSAARRILAEEFAAPDLARRVSGAGRATSAVAGVSSARLSAKVRRRVVPRRRSPAGGSSSGAAAGSPSRADVPARVNGEPLGRGAEPLAPPTASGEPPIATTAAETSILRQKVIGGLGWKLLSQVTAQGSRILVAIVLAHLLTPREFGLAAMALVLTSFAGIFNDLALGSALIQRSSITETDRSTVFWTTVTAGAVLTLLGVGLAPVAASFFSTPAVAPLFAGASALTFLWSLSATQMALLTREMNFRSLEIRQIGASLFATAAAFAMALVGFGAWTIVGQSLCEATAGTLLIWRLSSWRPKFSYSFESLRTLGSFGIKTLFSKILGYAIMNTDNLLIGRYLGSIALGVYTVAYNVMVLPAARIAQPIQTVFYTAFARVQHEPARLRRAWLRGTQLISAINVPAFLGLAVVAPDFVPVVLGPRWHSAVPVLQLLSLAGLAQCFQTLDWSVIQAVGRPGRVLRQMAFSAGIIVPAFVVGLQWGIVGVAGFFAVARAISTIAWTWATCRTIQMRITDFVRGVSRVAALSLPMAAVVYAARLGLLSAGVPAGLRLAVLVLLGIAVYVGLVAWRAPELIAEMRGLFRRRNYAG